jgi:hypothetical protein
LLLFDGYFGIEDLRGEVFEECVIYKLAVFLLINYDGFFEVAEDVLEVVLAFLPNVHMVKHV